MSKQVTLDRRGEVERVRCECEECTRSAEYSIPVSRDDNALACEGCARFLFPGLEDGNDRIRELELTEMYEEVQDG
jgi:RNase P subunit RPR2